VRSGPGEARTILLLYIISARLSKQPLMDVRTFLRVYMELGSYFVSERTNKRYHHRREDGGGVRSGPGAVRTILLFYIISDRPSKQPLMVRTFLKVYGA
jgi:hypothetical protein